MSQVVDASFKKADIKQEILMSHCFECITLGCASGHFGATYGFVPAQSTPKVMNHTRVSIDLHSLDTVGSAKNHMQFRSALMIFITSVSDQRHFELGSPYSRWQVFAI